MTETSWIEISKSALEQNIHFIRSLLGRHCIFSSVVKGNAYGHGISTFVPLAETCGLTHFAVYSAHEAYQVYQSSSENTTIMIMGTARTEDIEWAIMHDVEFFIFDLYRLKIAASLAEKHEKTAKVHIELETGLNRTGFAPEIINEVLDFLVQHPSQFEVRGVSSHFAGAESIANYHRIKTQMVRFRKMSNVFRQRNFPQMKKHIACSAAVVSYPTTILDLSRIGIMQYGFWPSRETKVSYLTMQEDKSDPLKRILSWKTSIAAIKHVKAGEYIGYGNAVLAEIDMVIAIIPVGYSDGYSRSLSNTGKVLIHGKRVDVVGIVNMNVTMVDVTHLSNVQIGDEVVLIGSQGNISITVNSFSELSSMLNYETLTRLPVGIPRHIVE